MGLMFQEEIKEIICFPKCNSVHTFFMKVPIDVFMLDEKFKILKISKSVKPYRIVLPKKDVYYVVETPIDHFNYKIGDKFDL